MSKQGLNQGISIYLSIYCIILQLNRNMCCYPKNLQIKGNPTFFVRFRFFKIYFYRFRSNPDAFLLIIYLVKLDICSWRGRNHGVRNTGIYSVGVEIMELGIQEYTV